MDLNKIDFFEFFCFIKHEQFMPWIMHRQQVWHDLVSLGTNATQVDKNQEKIVGTFTKSHLSILSTDNFSKLLQLTGPQSKGTVFMCHIFFPQLLYYIDLLNLECSRCFWGKWCINSCQNNVGCIQNDTEMQCAGEWYPKKGSLLAFHFEGTKSWLILKMTVAFR